MTTTLFNLTRRPWMFAQLFHGDNRTEQPNGSQAWWMDPQRSGDELTKRVTLARDLGAHHIMLNRPAGTDGSTHVPGANWLPLQEHQRQAIRQASAIGPELVPFSGSTVSEDPRSIKGWTQANPDGFEWLFKPDKHAASWIQNTAGWLSVGTKTFVIDAAVKDDRIDHYQTVSAGLLQSGITTVAESLPTGQNIPRNIYRMPYLEQVDLSMRRHPQLRLNPETTRCYVWWIGERSVGIENLDQEIKLLHDFMDRGFIPVISAVESKVDLFEVAMKKYKNEGGQL